VAAEPALGVRRLVFETGIRQAAALALYRATALIPGLERAMPSKKRLRSACQSTAHHAASGLSFVHPHVVRACRAAQIDHLEVGLLDREPCPPQFCGIEPLRRALEALKEKFEGILSSEGWSPADLVAARLWFSPVPGKDDYCTSVRLVLTPAAGEEIECAVDHLGRNSPTR